jgi:hypothetical protein
VEETLGEAAVCWVRLTDGARDGRPKGDVPMVPCLGCDSSGHKVDYGTPARRRECDAPNRAAIFGGSNSRL